VKAILKQISACAIVALACLAVAGCGSKVKGNTYDGGIVSIAFASGGKATFSTGPISNDCTYTESGSKVTVNCQGQPVDFTLDSDGNLNAPPESLIGKLTKRK
jgi:hypothetical protein